MEKQKKKTTRAFGEFLLKALGFGIALYVSLKILPGDAGRLILGFAALSAILLMIWVPKQKYFNERSTYAALLLAVMLFAGSGPDAPRQTDPALREIAANKRQQEKAIREEQMRQDLWIAQSQQAIKRKLKDPGSAQFRNVRFSRAGGSPVACGEVSSQNSYGGMSGFQRFVAAGESGPAVLQEEVADFAAMWNKMCAGAKSP